MKKYLITLIASVAPLLMLAQGWPADYGGVMLQGFYWDSFSDTKWTKLEKQADELSQYFDLIWIPQSGYCGGRSMGYDDLWWFNNYNSSFGTEAELRSMINTFKSKGLGTIADVVINHRRNLSNWVNFPKETYKGNTYEMVSTDIVRNDDGGNALSWAKQNGYELSVNNDSGEGWDGMRDLDHYSSNVQTIVNAYLDFLLNDLGYVGFRYDMVKGYRAGFTGMYNAKAQPQFSVGEYWDSATKTADWIRGTADKVNSVTEVEAGGNGGIQSAAFDFQFRYTVRNACNNRASWDNLGRNNDNYNGNWPLISNTPSGVNAADVAYLGNGEMRRYAVTFVENHDTEYRSSTAQQDPLKRDTIAANAYMMAMPGTPCVFFKHWLDCKQEIKGMIDVRKAVGITNTSTYSNAGATSSYYANMTTGTKGRLVVIVGNDLDALKPKAKTWVEVVRGYHYRYLMDRSMEIAWIDKASGNFNDPITVTLTAVSADDNAKVVYTTDGSTPTASSKQAASGTTLAIDKTTRLKVGLLTNGAVKGVQERFYNFEPTDVEPGFEPYDMTIHVKDPGWESLNFWSWNDDANLCRTTTSWPGDAIITGGNETSIAQTKTIGGTKFYCQTYRVTRSDFDVNFIFSKAGSPQTVDLGPFKHDAYLELDGGTTSDGKLTVRDITSDYDAVTTVRSDNADRPLDVYTIDGRLVRRGAATVEAAIQGLPRGIYIVNDKKVIVQ